MQLFTTDLVQDKTRGGFVGVSVCWRTGGEGDGGEGGGGGAVWNVHVIAGLNSHMWVEFNLVQGERVLQGKLMGVGKTAWQGSTLGWGADGG